MVTTIRHITQELDDFGTEFVTAMEHQYVDNRALADEITESLRAAFKDTPIYPEASEFREPSVTPS